MRVCAIVLAVLTLLAGAVTQAAASTITYHVSFSVTAFLHTDVGASPVDPVQGTFIIKFDPTQDYGDTTTGIKLTGLNINLGSKLGFNYQSSTDHLVVGGIDSGVGTVGMPRDDFELPIYGITGSSPGPGAFGVFLYSQLSTPTNRFFTANYSVEVTVSPAPVPATLPLFLTAIGAIGMAGYALQRQRAKVVAVHSVSAICGA